MKTLYLDLSMGAAGDMLTAALYELLDEKEKRDFLEKINSLGIEGVSVQAKNDVKCGISGTHMTVLIGGMEEHEHHHEHEHEHEHEHHHDHDHHHHHASLGNIEDTVDKLALNDNVRKNIKEVYGLIAAAESHVHDRPVSDIHFHEVGTADAITDVASVCILMDMLSPERVIASPVCTGFGKVKCAHGILGVPAPATAFLLRDIPVYAGDIEGELCTPTGAALIRFFADDFGRMPVMKIGSIGYGMGTKDLLAANCVRAFIGETEDAAQDVVELSCNVDDMTGEEIGYATQLFLDEGALDVYTVSIGMKKSRPGIKLTVMCKADDRQKFISLMFKHTTTIGIRENTFRRYVLERRSEDHKGSIKNVRIKTSEGYGICRSKYEYDDLAAVAKEYDISLREAEKRLDDDR